MNLFCSSIEVESIVTSIDHKYLRFIVVRKTTSRIIQQT